MRPCTRLLPLLVLALGACSGGGEVTVAIDLFSDLRPGLEVTRAVTRVFVGESSRLHRMPVESGGFGPDLIEGVRIAELELTPGSWDVEVTLWHRGTEVASDRQRLTFDASHAFQYYFPRCRGGGCSVVCLTDTDCPTPEVTCLVQRCVERVCFEQADDTLCGAGELCDPRTGCVERMTDAGVADGCASGVELCNGIDDDCSAATPDGADDPAVGSMCDGPDADLCPDGRFSCRGGALVCDDDADSRVDLCDGLDNDCDSTTPDGADDPALGGACDGADADLCDEGVMVCVGGIASCGDTTGDAVETCDGLDEDCDGRTDEAPAICGCERLESGARSYLFCEAVRDWSAARTSCVASGYDLVSIGSLPEQSLLRSRARAVGPALDWWIGLNDTDRDLVWTWIDGAPVTYDGWLAGEPSMGTVAEMVDGSGWAPERVDRLNPYICEAGP